MDEHIKRIAEKYWERVPQGEPQEDIARSLREDGYSILESIATIRILFNMSLRDARELIETHPAWQDHPTWQKREAPPLPQRKVWPSWHDIEAARKKGAVPSETPGE